MSTDNPKKPLNRIKSTVFGRTLSLAKLSLNAGTQMAGHGLSSLLKSTDDKEANWKNLITQQARFFSQEVGELKGSLMKAGQMLSMYGEHFFPPEVNQFLKTLQQDSPPLAWPAIQKILIQQLGPEKLELLDIDETPLASASMGQVHKAKVKSTGQILALKIQYPNVDKAIDSDLRAIKTFLSVIKILPQDMNFDPIFDEIKEMLVQETNYENEARMTKEYQTLLKEDSRYVIPTVIDEFSNKKVLATSFVKGLRVDDPLVQSLSQTRRNKLAENFLELYFKELFQWKFIQTDPHLGNYQIQIDSSGQDRLVLFDFGAAKKYQSEFMDIYGLMIKAALKNDLKMLKKASLRLKFIEASDSDKLQKLFEEFCLQTIEPFLQKSDPRATGKLDADGNYDWKNTDLPQRLSQMVLQMIKLNSPWRTPPQEILFVDRKTGGVFIFLSVLKAKINSFDLMTKYLDRIHDHLV